jgi:hypothetical protein
MHDRLMSDYEVTLVNDNSMLLQSDISCSVANIIIVSVLLLLDRDPTLAY